MDIEDKKRRWENFRKKKSSNNGVRDEVVEQPTAAPVLEDKAEHENFEIVDNYHFGEEVQDGDNIFSERSAEVSAMKATVKNPASNHEAVGSEEYSQIEPFFQERPLDVKMQLHDQFEGGSPVVSTQQVIPAQQTKVVDVHSYEQEPEQEEAVQAAANHVKPAAGITEAEVPVPAAPKQEAVVASTPLVLSERTAGVPETAATDDTVIHLIQDMHTKIDKIESTYISRSFVEKQQEDIINSLHRELIGYKENAYKEQLTPFMKGIISIINSQYKRIRELSKQLKDDNPAIEPVIEELKIVIEDLENLLYPYEIDRIPVKKGDRYNADIHKTLTRVVTADKEQDRTIRKVLGLGYQWGSRVIEKSSVETFIYEEKKLGGK